MPRVTPKSWTELTVNLTSDAGLSARNRAAFHYFNPHGLYAQLKALHDDVSAWCDSHPERPNGVMFVHGIFNDFNTKRLSKAVDKRDRVTKLEISLIENSLRYDVESGREWLATPAKWPQPKNS